MMKILEIPIECGEMTCASEPGKFCPYVMTQRWGQDWYCQLFSDTLKKFTSADCRRASLSTTKPGEQGWLKRHPKCLELERQKENT
jgi:hypothetical protein